MSAVSIKKITDLTIEPNVVYEVKDNETAVAFLQVAKKQGLKWCNDTQIQPKRNHFKDFKEDTAYILVETGLSYMNTQLLSGDKIIIKQEKE